MTFRGNGRGYYVNGNWYNYRTPFDPYGFGNNPGPYLGPGLLGPGPIPNYYGPIRPNLFNHPRSPPEMVRQNMRGQEWGREAQPYHGRQMNNRNINWDKDLRTNTPPIHVAPPNGGWSISTPPPPLPPPPDGWLASPPPAHQRVQDDKVGKSAPRRLDNPRKYGKRRNEDQTNPTPKKIRKEGKEKLPQTILSPPPTPDSDKLKMKSAELAAGESQQEAKDKSPTQSSVEIQLKVLRSLAKTREATLKRRKLKDRVWMEEVSAFRLKSAGHPDYSDDCPQEQRFRQLRKRIDKRIQMAKDEFEKVSKKIELLSNSTDK